MMSDAGEPTYEEMGEILREYLSMKGYEVIESVGSQMRSTFTYRCESEGMPYWVKIEQGNGDDDKRIRVLQNEVAALIALWGKFPTGETDSFILPPGPEDIFEENGEGRALYGYSRFYVEGSVLGGELRSGSEKFEDWADKYSSIIKSIDALPELDLPRTEEKKDVDFNTLLVENAGKWADRLEEFKVETLGECADSVVEGVEKFFSTHKVVTGTVHGDIIPDHLVYLNGGVKPTLVNFGKLCQWYPRYFDVAMLYGWVRVVLQDCDGAQKFWDSIMKNGLKKEEIDQVKMMTNVLLLGLVGDYMSNEGKGKKCPVGCDVFMEV